MKNNSSTLRNSLFLILSVFSTLCLMGCQEEGLAPIAPIENVKMATGDNIALSNPGFESNWSGWNDTDPSAISSGSHTGSKSAKITGSGAKFEQSISVSSNTNYILSAYVLEKGTVGVKAGSSDFNDGGDFNEWTKVNVAFNSGSQSSVIVYGQYNGGTGRFDDFSLTEGSGSGLGSSGKLSISSVSASANDGNVPTNTIDDNLSTRWSANGSGQYITYDLGSSKSISSMKIAWYKGDQRSSYFKIRAGASTASLSTIYNAQSSGSSGSSTALETYSFDAVDARYVRITGFGNSSNTWNSVTEAEIWGGTTSGGGSTAQYPSDLMDNYNQWKITYPDGVEDKTLFQESNEYFYLNNSKDAIVFRVPIRSSNGSTPNSSYIRSELRERTADGNSDIYWTTSGTHVVYSKQTITHLPINKDHLVATQIHGNKSDGIDDAMVLRLEGSHLFLSFNGGKLRSDLTIKTNYSLGTQHEVIFEVINGKHYCYYSEDGNLANAYTSGNASSYLVKDGSNAYVMNRDYDQSYFKIGNYTQSNADREGSDTNNPNNYGEVLVYDFWVSHN